MPARRSILAAVPLVALLCACATGAGRTPVEYTFQATTAPGPMSLAELDSVIRRTAAAHRAEGVDRVVFVDIAYPESVAEYQRMRGFGLMWVTAFSREKAEMPPRNVRLFTFRSGIVHLNPVTTFQTVETDPRIADALGEHRFDGVYLVPVTLETMGAEVMADFQKNRLAFKLGTIRDVPPTSMGAMYSLEREMPFPGADEIAPMLMRKYPLVGAVARRRAEQKGAP